ncbi:MAG: hypothetical protein AAGD07_17575 [Planctomycetota bacterium]
MATDTPGLITRRGVPDVLFCVAMTSCLSVVAADNQPDSDWASGPQPGVIARVDSVMWVDPKLAQPRLEYDTSGAPTSLWMRALQRPDPELQRMVVDTFALAHRRNMSGVEVVVDELERLLKVDSQDAEVRRACVRALIQMNRTEHATLLAKTARQHGGEISRLVEPALAAWKSDAMAADWLSRLRKAETFGSVASNQEPRDDWPNRKSMLDAIQGAASLDLKEATESLWLLVDGPHPFRDVRLAAADALGCLHASGLTDKAKAMVDRQPADLMSDLTALRLLQRHRSDDAIAVLTQLTHRSEPAVKSEAFRRLFAIDPSRLLEMAEHDIASEDANIRRWIARALVHNKSPDDIPQIATLLDDVNPSLRDEIARALIDMAAEQDLRELVIRETTKVLNQDAWRGCEQATIVMVNVNHPDISDRLVELLFHPRGEVMTTAGWALRRFAIAKHLPSMLERSWEIFRGFQNKQLGLADSGLIALQQQLLMAFGQMKYEPADDLMRRFIPKRFDLGDGTRSAAIWGLGYLHEDEPDPALVSLLEGRLNDVSDEDPELDDVRRMAAVSLGRMRAKRSLGTLRQYGGQGYSPISQSCEWSIARITDTPQPALPAQPPRQYNDWFLRPN